MPSRRITAYKPTYRDLRAATTFLIGKNASLLT